METIIKTITDYLNNLSLEQKIEAINNIKLALHE
jgi:hypothetical protein